MTLSWVGVEGDNWFFYWYDRIDEPNNRFIGYEERLNYKAFGFWWFCVIWGYF